MTICSVRIRHEAGVEVREKRLAALKAKNDKEYE